MNNFRGTNDSKFHSIQMIVTLALHVILLLDAAVYINNYTDFFLGSAFVLLIAYLIYILITSAKRRISIVPIVLFYACTLTQIAVFGTGVIDLGSHPLGGGGIGAVLYIIGMVIFCIILGIIALIKWVIMKGWQQEKQD